MREICTSGSVGGPGSNPRVYPTLSCHDHLRPEAAGRVIEPHADTLLHDQRDGFRLVGAETLTAREAHSSGRRVGGGRVRRQV
jgi:hypothetical protein